MSHAATNWAIKQRGLKPTAKIVLWHLCDRYHPDHGCFPSQETLADDCEISRASLNSWLAVLEGAGLIRRETRRDPDTKRHQSTFYRFPFEQDWPAPVSGGEPCPEAGHGSTEPSPKPGHGSVSNLEGEPCPENGESRVQILDTNPVREPVRESVSARASNSDDQGFSPQRAWHALGAVWPSFSAQSEERCLKALGDLTAAERKLVVERVPAFLEEHKGAHGGKVRLPYLDTYIREKHRWAVPSQKPAAAADGVRRLIGAFDRAWWWLFFNAVRQLGDHLCDPRSPQSSFLRGRIDLTRKGIGWKVDPGKIADIEASAKSFVQIAVDGPEFQRWAAALRKRLSLPRPDAIKFIWVPSEYPPDDEITLQGAAE